MIVVFSMQTINETNNSPEIKTKRGIVFANSYSEAVKKIESKTDVIVDIYLTTVEDDYIELSDEEYDNLLERDL